MPRHSVVGIVGAALQVRCPLLLPKTLTCSYHAHFTEDATEMLKDHEVTEREGRKYWIQPQVCLEPLLAERGFPYCRFNAFERNKISAVGWGLKYLK